MTIPTKNILYPTLLLLFCLLSYDFFTDAKKDFFILNYNWEKATVKPICNAIIVDYNINRLELATDGAYNYNNQKTYVVDDSYYFRAERIEIINNNVSFIGIYWINEYPRFLKGTVKLGESDLMLLQCDGPKIAMIGDSQMGWREGKYTRKWIAEKLKVHFVGNQYDVFGYPYIFETSYKSKMILESDLEIYDAEVIIVYLGLREDVESYTRNLRDFIASNNDKEIFVIHNTLKLEDDSLKIKLCGFDNAHCLNTLNYDAEKYFWEDRAHLNYAGHKKLAEELISKLKSLGISKN